MKTLSIERITYIGILNLYRSTNIPISRFKSTEILNIMVDCWYKKYASITEAEVTVGETTASATYEYLFCS